VASPLLSWIGFATVLGGLCAGGQTPDKVKVTVVVILASEGKEHVDAELKWIAQEVRKKKEGANLTCFKVKSINCRSLAVDEKESFQLVDDKIAKVVVKQGADKANRVGLAVTAPEQGEIVYRTVCGKFLPIITRYQTKTKERLILAVRVQPCNGGK
jgi:hypothetical protein